MYVKKLSLKSYRNLKEVTIEPCPTVNVIYGNNAQGKTNLIESIWLFTGNASFRSGKLSELIDFEEKNCELSMIFEDTRREQKAKIKIHTKKEFYLNQVLLKKSSEIAGHFYCVVFSPADLELASGSPRHRRKFLDLAICQMTPQYTGYLEQYEKVLEQRNALLKDCIRFPDLKDTIDVWDYQLAKLGTILSIYRNDYIKKLSKTASAIYFGLSSEEEQLTVSYDSSVFDEIEKVEKYEDSHIDFYYQKLKEAEDQDIRFGFTSVGIHRDDLELLVNGLPVKTFGSRGQVRSSALALKLGEAEVLKKITGENPIILLDDVMSELDLKRQDYILNHVQDKQVFITCCDIFNTIHLKNGKIFQVDHGKIISDQMIEQKSNRE